MTSSTSALTALPTELLCLIAKDLDIHSLRSLRLASPLLAQKTSHVFGSNFLQELHVRQSCRACAKSESSDYAKLYEISRSELLRRFVQRLCIEESERCPLAKKHRDAFFLERFLSRMSLTAGSPLRNGCDHQGQRRLDSEEGGGVSVDGTTAAVMLSKLQNLQRVDFTMHVSDGPPLWQDWPSLRSLCRLLEAINTHGIRLQEFTLNATTSTYVVTPTFPISERGHASRENLLLRNLRCVPNVRYHFAAVERLGMWKDTPAIISQAFLSQAKDFLTETSCTAITTLSLEGNSLPGAIQDTLRILPSTTKFHNLTFPHMPRLRHLQIQRLSTRESVLRQLLLSQAPTLESLDLRHVNILLGDWKPILQLLKNRMLVLQDLRVESITLRTQWCRFGWVLEPRYQYDHNDEDISSFNSIVNDAFASSAADVSKFLRYKSSYVSLATARKTTSKLVYVDNGAFMPTYIKHQGLYAALEKVLHWWSVREYTQSEFPHGMIEVGWYL